MARNNTEKFTPEPGTVYRQQSGGKFLCVCCGAKAPTQRDAVMINIFTGYTIHAHGLRRWPDGHIEWDYSTGGTFAGE